MIIFNMLGKCLISAILFIVTAQGKIVNFEEYGGVANDMSNLRAWENGRLMNESLNSLEPGHLLFLLVVSITNQDWELLIIFIITNEWISG